MPQITMIKDWKSRKVGDSWSPSESTAKHLIAGGFAVAVETIAEVTESPAVLPDVNTEPLQTPSEPASEPPAETDDSAPSDPSPKVDPSESQIALPSRYAKHRSWINPS